MSLTTNDPTLLARITAGLNPNQAKAVVAPLGPVLVTAGAGAGKTRVLTRRIAYLIGIQHVSPFNILAITFTNKAADEMKERLAKLVPAAARAITTGTFHSLGYRIMQHDIRYMAGYKPNFTVLDTDQQNVLLNQIIKDLTKQACITPANHSDQGWGPRLAESYISKWKNKGLLPQDLAKAQFDDPLAPEALQIYSSYQKELWRANVMDFDDLLLNPVRLFAQHPEVLAYYQSFFQFIHVDEYQDTNSIQSELISLLAQKAKSLFVVGDADQSIYSWRGAEIEHIQSFAQTHPHTDDITLNQNYRSTPEILAVANDIIKYNPHDQTKKLWSQINPDLKPAYFRAEDADQEAAFVAERSQYLIDRQLARPQDITVLYRTNAASRPIEAEMLKRHIPYTIVNGTKFYDRKEIRDALAYYRLAMNPNDDFSFARIINTPKRGVGNVTASKLAAYASAQNISLFSATYYAAQIGLSQKMQAVLSDFQTFIASLQGLLRNNAIPLAINQINHRLQTNLDGTPNPDYDDDRIENAAELETVADHFVKHYQPTTAPDGTRLTTMAIDFLGQAQLASAADSDDAQTTDKLKLMTVHAAKGLEFPIVFIIGLEEGEFPSWSISERVKQLESAGKSTRTADNEERRLMYVAVTRAEKRLYLTNALSRYKFGQTHENAPSRFISEIDPDHLTVIDAHGVPKHTTSTEENKRTAPYRSNRWQPHGYYH